MDIPKKFKINTEDFKIYFDNTKKTHVAENIETGEKTNIGVLGILMQMGIVQPLEDKSVDKVSERLDNIERKIDDLTGNIGSIKTGEEKEPSAEVTKKPKSEINERIMKKVLEQSEETEGVEEETTEEEPESDVVEESDEEVDNWNEI
jgi:hypothetical protein